MGRCRKNHIYRSGIGSGGGAGGVGVFGVGRTEGTCRASHEGTGGVFGRVRVRLSAAAFLVISSRSCDTSRHRIVHHA